MKFSKEHIISEIRRTAEENNGKSLGFQRFFKITGIRQADWLGKFWARWGDAVIEAGYVPNEFQSSFDDEEVIRHLVSFIKELGHYPVRTELQMKARSQKGFPSHTVFQRVGRKAELVLKTIDYCQKRSGFEDVIMICKLIAPLPNERNTILPETGKEEILGYVYMTKVRLKNASSYKIGSSAFPYKRIKQLNTRSPVEEVLIHEIKTNYTKQSENYWHKKFSDKRESTKEGSTTEYFNLQNADVQLFKKYKSMMWQLIFTPSN